MNGIFFFGMSNALINPLIYGAFHIRDAAIHQVKHSDAPARGTKALCARQREIRGHRMGDGSRLRRGGNAVNGHNPQNR